MKLIKPKELPEYGLSKSTAQKLRAVGGGPPFIRRGASVLYLAEDLEAWLKSQRVGSNAEAGARQVTTPAGSPA